jgi:hypothetical protein
MSYSTIEELRIARDEALANSDFLMLPDAPRPEGLLDLIIAYRQELRDIPKRAEAEGLENLELPSPPPISFGPGDVGVE